MLIIRTTIDPWVSSKEASLQLGFSEKTLKCLIYCGYLKAGKHWRHTYHKSSPALIFNLFYCKKEMKEWWGRNALAGP